VVPPSWLWIPLTLFAAAAQTVRNTAQRHLVNEVGTLGATLVRFLYGMPVLALWFAILLAIDSFNFPVVTWPFVAWILAAALSQMAGTAFLLRAMTARSFAIGLVYSKSEVIQVAIFSALFLGDALSLSTAIAVGLATLGVILLSPRLGAAATSARSWTDAAALYGLASGATFAISAVSYRGANLALAGASPFLAAAETLFWSQLLQTLLLGAWLLARNPTIVLAILRQWRVSTFAGVSGALASLTNVTALAIAPPSLVRTLILVEVVFSYVVSRKVFHETVSGRELIGIVLVVSGAALIVATAH